MIDNNLVKQYKISKSDKIFEQILNRTRGLIYDFIFKTTTNSYLIEELYQIGSIAVFKALCKFDPDRNVNFSTYVYHYIKYYIMRYSVKYKTKSRTDHFMQYQDDISVDVIYKFNNTFDNVIELDIQKAINIVSTSPNMKQILELKLVHDYEMNDREISEMVGVSRARVQKILSDNSIKVLELLNAA